MLTLDYQEVEVKTLPLRIDGRIWDEPRETTIEPGYQKFAEGSALITVGSNPDFSKIFPTREVVVVFP